MAECNNCGHFVSSDFVRVFGDEDGALDGCPHCRKQSEHGTGTREGARAE